MIKCFPPIPGSSNTVVAETTAAMRKRSDCVSAACRSQPQLSAVQHRMGDVTLERPCELEDEEDDESEECDEDEDEDWVWHSTGADLTKRYNRTGLNSQVRPMDLSDHSCLCQLSADGEPFFLSSLTGKTGPVRPCPPAHLTKL